MKFTILLILGICSSLAYARTWTNAEGTKKFEGTYIRSNDSTVTVFRKGGSQTFKLDLLSKIDQEWVATEFKRIKEKNKKPEVVKPEDSFIAKNLKNNLSRFVKDEYKKVELEKAPEYYLLYFSASW